MTIGKPLLIGLAFRHKWELTVEKSTEARNVRKLLTLQALVYKYKLTLLTRVMNVKNMGEPPLLHPQASLHTWKPTVEGSFSNVTNVAIPLLLHHILLVIVGLTLERSILSVAYVGKPFKVLHNMPFICELMLKRNPANVSSAEEPLLFPVT